MWPEYLEFSLILTGLCASFALPAHVRSDLRPVMASLVLAFAVEGVAVFLPMTTGFLIDENTWLYNVYLPMDMGATTWLIAERLRLKRPLRITSVALLMTCAMVLLELRSLNDVSAFPNHVFLLINLSACAGLVGALFKDSQEVDGPLLEHWAFWVMLGHLFYYGAMMPLNGLVDHVYQTDPLLAERLSIISPLLAALRYLFLAVGIFIAHKWTRHSRSHAGV